MYNSLKSYNSEAMSKVSELQLFNLLVYLCYETIFVPLEKNVPAVFLNERPRSQGLCSV